MERDRTAAPATGRWKKFAGDLGIYAVGTLGAKVLTFLMVPLYTFFVPNPADFSYFDNSLTATFLLSALVTVDLRDGVFRFLLDAPDDATRQRVVTATTRVLAHLLLVSLCVQIGLACVIHIRYWPLVLLLLLGIIVNDVYSQMLRGLGLNKMFAGMGLATAGLIVLLSVALVGWLHMGIAGIFIANAAARLLPALVVELWLRPASRQVSWQLPWRDTARTLLHYTLPLLPTVLIWWVLTFGDRWFVRWFVGAEANGVYAVAARLTGVIYTFTIIIQQAWQETAILQYGSADRDRFFSQVFAAFIYIISLIVIAFVVMLKLCYGWLVEAHYATSIDYVFPMAMTAALFSLASFLEMGYQCACDTRRALVPSVITGILNVLLNLVLAPLMGVWGVIAASLGTFSFLVIYRYFDTRRYFALRPGWRVLVPVSMMLMVGVAGNLSLPTWVYIVLALTALECTLWSLPARTRQLIKQLRQLAGGHIIK